MLSWDMTEKRRSYYYRNRHWVSGKKGDQVDESKIQKMFITGENKQLLEMIGAIPPEYFELVEEIFEKAKEEYGFLPKEKGNSCIAGSYTFLR